MGKGLFQQAAPLLMLISIFEINPQNPVY